MEGKNENVRISSNMEEKH